MAKQFREDTTKAIKSRIIEYISDRGEVTRNDIIQECGFSLPTVLQKIKELKESGLIAEVGQSESSGGRKAKIISIVRDSRLAIGINITNHHLEMVLVGLDGVLLNKERIRFHFEPTYTYYEQFGRKVEEFVSGNVTDREKILGIGISLPGVLDNGNRVIRKSHAFQLENYSLMDLEKALPYPVVFENDGNAAALSEKRFRTGTAFYLSLNATVGGAFSVNGKPYGGVNNKSSEIGHMILFPEGKTCYCGKKGCVDSYCSAKVLGDGNLQEFFSLLEDGNEENRLIWDRYLENLSVVISNIRMLNDCEIIVGGHVGGYMEKYLSSLRLLTMQYDYLDQDALFIHCGKYRWEASAYGMAFKLIHQFFSTVV
ncbi:ROK family transcriptional regulator [Ruminococcus gauvreauii]|uniref:ROK family transcriptional regulator n=1 Tax=Ruminococcus gauvreauii TaxID=438033 RepID=A0ABY5VLB5_9FIRM|nr:ROK family transcriptional regulator [Ruminococcus gauvreauii]UWP61102.1 ROK family transcriptional regulator [Ruminococcus gauvreauii]